MVVTVGTMEAEVGVTLVEAVRLVGAMMDGRGESTVEGINILERERELRWNLEARGHALMSQGPRWVRRKKGGGSCLGFCFWGQFFFFSGIVLLLLHSV